MNFGTGDSISGAVRRFDGGIEGQTGKGLQLAGVSREDQSPAVLRAGLDPLALAGFGRAPTMRLVDLAPCGCPYPKRQQLSTPRYPRSGTAEQNRRPTVVAAPTAPGL